MAPVVRASSRPPFSRRALRLGGRMFLLAAATTVLAALIRTPGPALLRSVWHALRSGAETPYSRHDVLLGWSSRPALHISDMYGPGRSLTTDAQGFRHIGTVAPDPGTRRRIMCVGDSFTFGHGVGDADTWCERLGAAGAAIETVNMGQDGYGLDQAFLRYRRDAAGLRHDLVLFAFIASDFDRMRSARFDGYPKPTLQLTDGRLHAAHVPVPGALGVRGRLERALFELERMRSVEVLHAGIDRPRGGPVPDRDSLDTTVAAAVSALGTLARARGARLVLVQLPTGRDYLGSDADHWRRFIPLAARRAGAAWVDLIPAMRRLPIDSAAALFIPRDGHYSVAGNAWVAARLRTFVAGALATAPVRAVGRNARHPALGIQGRASTVPRPPSAVAVSAPPATPPRGTSPTRTGAP